MELNSTGKAAFRSVLPVILAELALSALMLGVYALFSLLNTKVLLGAALGTVAALANFGIMTLLLLKAERAETPEKGQLYVRGTYAIRMVALLVVLVVALKSGCFDPLATLLPLCLMRLALFVGGLIQKK